MDDPPPIPPPSPAPSSQVPFPRLHLLQAFVFFAGIGWTGLDPFASALASIAVAWVHALVFLRCNPRLAGIELILLILTAYYWPGQSLYAVLWIAAGALAGGTVALLAVRRAREEDFYFLAPAAAVVAYGILVWLAEGCRFSEPVAVAGKWLRTERALVLQLLPTSPLWPELQSQYSPEGLAMLPAAWMLSLGTMWTMGLWLAGRSARRWGGALDLRRASLILFRIEQHYLFLLICPLVLWILGILAGREKLALVAAGPVLAAFAAACAIEGLAVALFRMAVWRLTVPAVPWRIMAASMALLAFLFFHAAIPSLALLGLADIWFDFRRVRSVEERFGASG